MLSDVYNCVTGWTRVGARQHKQEQQHIHTATLALWLHLLVSGRTKLSSSQSPTAS